MDLKSDLEKKADYFLVDSSKSSYRSRTIVKAFYLASLLTSISIWFLAIRAPLWLDETSSYWQISGGFWQIPSRQGISFALYSYILWLSTLILGKSEIALRVPEVLAMLVAVYLLYLAARDLFGPEIAIATSIVFCLNPIVAFAAIDARPYAFAVLAVNGTLLCLIRLRHHDSNLLAATFGFLAALILYFHLLFGVILPFFALCFFWLKRGDRKVRWQQWWIALSVCFLALLPVIPRMLVLVHAKGALVFENSPTLAALVFTLSPGWAMFAYLTAIILGTLGRVFTRDPVSRDPLVFCVLLGLAPILVLFLLSVSTPLQIFIPRYRLVGIPGLALCWGWLISRLNSRKIQAVFCVVLVGLTAFQSFLSPLSRRHGYTWKYAIDVAEQNTARDGAPIIVCSDFPGADVMPMPRADAVKDSALFTTLTYYRISAPVVGFPRTLNPEAIRQGRTFLQGASRKRFLALGYRFSSDVLQWLAENAAATHQVKKLGVLDGVTILEFEPRSLGQTPPA